MRESGIAIPESDRRLEGLSNATESQMLAFARDLHELASNAKQQGSDALKAIQGPQTTTDTTLKAPDPSDPRQVAAAFVVMTNRLLHGARDAADETQRLVLSTSKVADPATRAFAIQLADFAKQLRPPGMPPGPYAPPS